MWFLKRNHDDGHHTIPILITGAFTALTIIIGLFALNNDITIIFQNLFYIPIIVSCYFFQKRGFLFSSLICFIYMVMMASYSTETSHLTGAIIRTLIFLLVASIVTYLTIMKLKAEKDLKESEAFNRKLVEDMPNLVTIIDQNKKIKYVNKMVTSTLGYTIDDVLGTPLTDYVDLHRLGQNTVIFDDCISAKKYESFEISLIQKGGAKSTVISRCVPMVFEENPATLILFADISDCKKAEEALKKANKKLQTLSGITRHDINNALMVLMGNLELLKERIDDPNSLSLISRADTSAQNISNMVEFTKEYDSVGMDSPEWQEWGSIFSEVSSGFGDSSIGFVNGLPAGLRIFSDPTIMKVFYNLIDNSLRHGSNVTRISLSTLDSDNGLSVIYEDDGIGIQEDSKSKIFEKGFGKNTGMGMFLVKELLSMTNIEIVENGLPELGARFEMTIPPGAFRYCLG